MSVCSQEEVLNDLQAKASKRATLLLGGCLAALGCQFSAFLWLIFYELSWDVMEPISYFFGGGLSVAGYSYALAARQDWSYEVREADLLRVALPASVRSPSDKHQGNLGCVTPGNSWLTTAC